MSMAKVRRDFLHNINAITTNQLRWLWLSICVFLLDQASKLAVANYLVLFQPKKLLPILNLDFIPNMGASFGFLNSAGGWQRWLFIAVAVIISVFILHWLYRLPRNKNWTACALALVLGGALGNLFDRIVHGYVTDFIQVHYHDWYFPTFNVADSAITVGVILWLIIAMRKV